MHDCGRFTKTHSQIRITFHPALRRVRFTRRSRAMLPASFLFQKARLAFGLGGVLGAAVPEAAVHEECEARRAEDEVGLSRTIRNARKTTR